MIKKEGVFLSLGESGHGWGGVAGRLAGEVVTAVMAEVEDRFVVCVASDP